MHSKQIQAELNHLMETLHEQFTAINEQEGKIPRIEIDLMMSTLRSLYERIHQLSKVQDRDFKENKVTSEPTAIPVIQPSVLNETSVIETEKVPVFEKIKEVTEPVAMESISFEKEEEPVNELKTEPETGQTAPLFTPVFELFEEPKIPLPAETIVLKEEQTITIKTERANSPAVRKPVQTAGLFDEVTTVAESYSVKTTLHDKMSTGRNDRSVADNLQNKPLTDLKKSIGINEKFVFVRELFEGDHQLFNNSIEKLNSFSAYEQARRHLFEELAGQMNWNMESKAFHELSDLVKRRFTS